jgi:hypothetical protein
MTHGQTFPGPSGKSVNIQDIKENLPHCMYSFILSPILHYIVYLRILHPKKRIYLCKFDLDASTVAAMLAVPQPPNASPFMMALRLTFGGSPCPSIWGLISETIIDICNAFIINKFWDHKIFDPISNHLLEMIYLPDSTPFHPAKELSVKLPKNDMGLADIYINDSIGVALDIDPYPSRVNKAIALAIHSLARPIDPLDPIPRNPIISQKKLLADS